MNRLALHKKHVVFSGLGASKGIKKNRKNAALLLMSDCAV